MLASSAKHQVRFPLIVKALAKFGGCRPEWLTMQICGLLVLISVNESSGKTCFRVSLGWELSLCFLSFIQFVYFKAFVTSWGMIWKPAELEASIGNDWLRYLGDRYSNRRCPRATLLKPFTPSRSLLFLDFRSVVAYPYFIVRTLPFHFKALCVGSPSSNKTTLCTASQAPFFLKPAV